jgi:hypothetical protein
VTRKKRVALMAILHPATPRRAGTIEIRAVQQKLR